MCASSEEETLSVESTGFSSSSFVLSLLHRQWFKQWVVHGDHALITSLLLLLLLLLFSGRKVEAFLSPLPYLIGQSWAQLWADRCPPALRSLSLACPSQDCFLGLRKEPFFSEI